MKEPVLIIGGSGFLGSHLNARLKADGLETIVMDVMPSPKFVKGDVRDYDAVKKISEGAGTIFHLAGELPPHGWTKGERGRMWDVMVNGTENVMRAALENSAEKVIYISSSAVYGVPTQDELREDAPKNPLDEYGKSKLRAEEICGEYIGKGLDVTTIRPMTILGKGFVGILRLMMEFIYQGKKVYLLNDGSNRIQLIHVSDVVNACILAANSKKSKGEVFNIASHNPPTLREQLEDMIKYAGSKSRLTPLPTSLVKFFLMLAKSMGMPAVGKEFYSLGDKTFLLSTEKAEKLLGWKPRYTNIECLKEAYDWYRRNREVAKPILSPLMKIAFALS